MKILLCLILLLLFGVPVVAQEATRQIIPEEFIKARPTKGTGTKKVTYLGSKTLPPAGANVHQLGVTLWRLRPAHPDDKGARITVENNAGVSEFIPERLSSDATLRVGDRIRLSFESPRKGYLYLIDRERYANGSFGEPMLIFPTLRTRQGDNSVEAGRVIEIPGQEDLPNFFTLSRTRSDQVEEVITVIVTAKPLTELTIGRDPVRLPADLVSKWERDWGAQQEKFELQNGAGTTWTKAEKAAGASATRQLTQEEPAPQTVYRVVTKPDAPLLVRVPLRYRRQVR